MEGMRRKRESDMHEDKHLRRIIMVLPLTRLEGRKELLQESFIWV